MSLTSLNTEVKVKLTETGRDILESQRKNYEVDGDGFSKFQLWDLVHIFGDYIRLNEYNYLPKEAALYRMLVGEYNYKDLLKWQRKRKNKEQYQKRKEYTLDYSMMNAIEIAKIIISNENLESLFSNDKNMLEDYKMVLREIRENCDLNDIEPGFLSYADERKVRYVTMKLAANINSYFIRKLGGTLQPLEINVEHFENPEVLDGIVREKNINKDSYCYKTALTITDLIFSKKDNSQINFDINDNSTSKFKFVLANYAYGALASTMKELFENELIVLELDNLENKEDKYQKVFEIIYSWLDMNVGEVFLQPYYDTKNGVIEDETSRIVRITDFANSFSPTDQLQYSMRGVRIPRLYRNRPYTIEEYLEKKEDDYYIYRKIEEESKSDHGLLFSKYTILNNQNAFELDYSERSALEIAAMIVLNVDLDELFRYDEEKKKQYKTLVSDLKEKIGEEALQPIVIPMPNMMIGHTREHQRDIVDRIARIIYNIYFCGKDYDMYFSPNDYNIYGGRRGRI